MIKKERKKSKTFSSIVQKSVSRSIYRYKNYPHSISLLRHNEKRKQSINHNQNQQFYFLFTNEQRTNFMDGKPKQKECEPSTRNKKFKENNQ